DAVLLHRGGGRWRRGVWCGNRRRRCVRQLRLSAGVDAHLPAVPVSGRLLTKPARLRQRARDRAVHRHARGAGGAAAPGTVVHRRSVMTAITAPPESARVRPSAAKTSKPAVRESLLVFVARHAIAIAIVVCALAPVVFIVLTSFMSEQQSLSSDFWPKVWHFGNYVDVFRKLDMGRFLLNTLLYAVLATGFMLISSVPAAYALAKLRWRGRNFVFLVLICMMLLPPQITTVPLYLWWANFPLTGTLWPLILPNLLGDAFSIFLLRQFMVTIPDEYLDAARVDGAGEWRTLLRVIVPMARPGIAASG